MFPIVPKGVSDFLEHTVVDAADGPRVWEEKKIQSKALGDDVRFGQVDRILNHRKRGDQVTVARSIGLDSELSSMLQERRSDGNANTVAKSTAKMRGPSVGPVTWAHSPNEDV
jgi:hypothetical protein